MRELFIHHSVSILCFVEAGQPKKGLSHDAKAAFENAVQSGASGHISGTLGFLWADDNEALLLAHLGAMSVSKGQLIRKLYVYQSWRNAMPYYLEGPTAQDQILILLSHQPASQENKYSPKCKEEVVKALVNYGLKRAPGAPEHSRFIIGGDLNMSTSMLKMLADAHTKDEVQVATANDKSGDVAIGLHLKFIKTKCVVTNRDPQHDIVLVKFHWPSVVQPDSVPSLTAKRPLLGVWAKTSSSANSGAAEHTVTVTASAAASSDSTPAVTVTVSSAKHTVTVIATAQASSNSTPAVASSGAAEHTDSEQSAAAATKEDAKAGHTESEKVHARSPSDDESDLEQTATPPKKVSDERSSQGKTIT